MTQDDAKAAGVGWLSRPMYCLPAEDAHLREWLRPISGKMVTRRTSYFSNDEGFSTSAGSVSSMIQRINRKRRKRAAKINMQKFWRLHDLGMSGAEMAALLNVSTRTIERAKTMRRLDV